MTLDVIIIALILAFIALLIWIWKKVNPPIPPVPPKSVSLVSDTTLLFVGETINFNGMVISESDPPLPISGANVTVNITNTAPIVVVTDANGMYVTPFIPTVAGNYIARARLDSGEESEDVTFIKSQFEGLLLGSLRCD